MTASDRDPVEAGGVESNVQARRALGLMEHALALLDADNGPPEAGAHLDIAIHRLRDWLSFGS